MADVPYGFQHPGPDAVARDYKEFKVTAGVAAKRIEQNNLPGQVGLQVFLESDDTNADPMTIGPDQNADFHTLNPGDTYALPNTGSPITMGNWWCKAASGAPVLKVTFK